MSARRWMVLAGLAVLGTALAGCGGDDGDDGPDSTTSSVAAVDPARVSPADLPEVPALSDPVGAAADVDFGECGTGEGAQQVAATVMNSAEEARDYVVTISWVNASSDVLARAVATVEDLGPGASHTAELNGTVPAGVTDCTVHVQAGNLTTP